MITNTETWNLHHHHQQQHTTALGMLSFSRTSLYVVLFSLILFCLIFSGLPESVLIHVARPTMRETTIKFVYWNWLKAPEQFGSHKYITIHSIRCIRHKCASNEMVSPNPSSLNHVCALWQCICCVYVCALLLLIYLCPIHNLSSLRSLTTMAQTLGILAYIHTHTTLYVPAQYQTNSSLSFLIRFFLLYVIVNGK